MLILDLIFRTDLFSDKYGSSLKEIFFGPVFTEVLFSSGA